MHLNVSKAFQIDLNRMARTYLEHYHHVVMIKRKAAENVGPFQNLEGEQIAKTKMVIEDHMSDSLQTKEVDIGCIETRQAAENIARSRHLPECQTDYPAVTDQKADPAGVRSVVMTPLGLNPPAHLNQTSETS